MAYRLTALDAKSEATECRRQWIEIRRTSPQRKLDEASAGLML
jgi:hypothetical protein